MALPMTLSTANAAGETWGTGVALKGQTTAVLVNNVNNSGITRFDYNYNGTLDTYEARLVRVAEPPFLEGIAYIVKGWAWNDNLGWVSFYCDGNDGTDGQPVKAGTNLGAACGNQTYGVKLKYHTASGDEPGYFSFSGYAWNDATGYISMNSTNGGSIEYGLRLDANGVVVSDYQSDPFSPEAHLMKPWAWSQSLTWINFAGVTADIDIQVIPEPTCGDTDFVGVCPDVCIEVDGIDLCNEDEEDDDNNDDTVDDPAEVWELDDLDVYTTPAFPVADGVDSYKIKLQFKDGEGNSISKEALANYDVRIFFEWEDTVKRDQVNGSKAIETFKFLQKPFTDGAGAVTIKPVFLFNNETTLRSDLENNRFIHDTTDFGKTATNIGSGTWTDEVPNTPEQDLPDEKLDTLNLYVKSLAPTSGGNKSRVWSMGPTVYRNNDIGVGDEPKEMNNLKLKAVHWILKSPSGSEIKGSTPYTNSLALNFRPALEVETLNTVSNVDENKDTLVLYRNVETKVEVEGSDPQRIKSGSPILPTSTKMTLSLNKGTDVFEISTKNQEGTEAQLPLIKDFSTLSSLSNMTFTPSLLEKTVAYTSGVTLNTEIKYPITLKGISYGDVSYYSNFLPRTDSSIANPVAVVQGSLYGTGRTTQTGIELTGIGDNNTNIVKDTVYENVKKLARGKSDSQSDATVNGNFVCTGCETIPVGNEDENVLYVKGRDVTISSDTTWNKNTILIVDGGNLYINGNLLYNESDPKITTKKLGLIVIRNTEDELKDAGNIYIAPNVTNIQAFAVVWGAVFSYDGNAAAATDSNGAFKWGGYDGNQMVELLSKQLIWQGGISSNNTIGGVDESDKYYKTGYQILAQNENNLLTAKQYDLNYFRYFRKKMNYNRETGEAIDENEDGEITVDDMTIDTTNQAKGALETETNPFYIKYVPPYSKSVIFGKEKGLTF